MGNLTKNISRHELACNCGCGSDSMDWETISVVQGTCTHFEGVLGVEKVTLRINSGHRCFQYNKKPISLGGPGSNDNSQHPQARAIDFSIDGVTPLDVYIYLVTKYPDKYGVGKYDNFTHFDARTNGPARWG
jgi:uncharacterized protein YcbK (DUF882 family)